MPTAAAGSTESKADQNEERVRKTQRAKMATSFIEQAQIPLIIEAPNGKTVNVETTHADCILDVRQFLLDCAETCDLTCYHFEIDGNELNDYVEMASIPELLENPSQVHILKIVPDFYDERASRLHVRRLRELLVNPPRTQNNWTGDLTAGKKRSTAELSEALARKTRKPTKKTATDAINGILNDAASSSSTVLVDGKKGQQPVLIEDSPQASLSSGELSLQIFAELTRSAEDVIPKCVENINFSAWNPPPGNRQLRGDLLYLEVTTLEGNVLHITSSVNGFYLNKSTTEDFNPEEADAPYFSHTLLDLMKHASPLFAGRFGTLLGRKTTSHPFETMEVPRPISEWLKEPEEHKYDWNRSEDALLSTYGMNSWGVLRDWNEEYQSCRELPRGNALEQVIRDRTLFRVYMDFVTAATKGACAIVEGNIPPINPMDDKRMAVFIFNNIFFSMAVDGRDYYKETGGDAVMYQLANNDLHSIGYLNQIDTPGLYTLATTVVDFRGQRMIAQSIIPGIFHGERASKHVYGSMDQGQTIMFDQDFHKSLEPIAEVLHLQEHKVVDADGKEFDTHLGVETKGLVGSDGRSYILDLHRTTPRDANFPDISTHFASNLRHELIKTFTRAVALKKVEDTKSAAAKDAQERKERAEQKDETKEAGLDDEKKGTTDQGEGNKDDAPAMPTQEQQGAEYLATLKGFRFNCNVLSDIRLGGDKETTDADIERVQQASTYLTEQVIPQLIKAFKTLEEAPADGETLTKTMHSRGINMRYLGTIAKACQEEKVNYIEYICRMEMIARAAKHYLNEQLRQVRPDHKKQKEHWFLAPCISIFLNALFGENSCGAGLTDEQLSCAQQVLDRGLTLIDNEVDSKKNKKKKKKKNVLKFQDGSRVPTSALAPANLWQAVRNSVQAKFNFELPQRLSLSSRDKLFLLRTVCKKCGLQIAAKDYDWSTSEPVTSADILGLFPVIKCNPPTSKQCATLLEGGKACLSQNNVRAAYRYLMEALNFHNQVFGPMHADSAACYNLLALVCYHAQDFLQAIEHAQRCLVINERVLGRENSETAHAHSNLALYLHCAGRFDQAIEHLQRALYLFELIAGPNHPDTAACHTNLATIYQDVGKIDLGIKHLEIALQRNRATFGDEHIQVAMSYHAIAVAHSLLGAFRVALSYEKQSKVLLIQHLGKSHPRVQQSLYWLNQFTAGAVNVAQGKGFIQNKLRKVSPLNWVSLRSNRPFKGKLTMQDVLQLFENAAEQQSSESKGASASVTNPSTAVEAEADDYDDGAGSTDAQNTRSQRRKEKRKRQRAKKREERVRAIAEERRQEKLAKFQLQQEQLKAYKKALAEQQAQNAAKNAEQINGKETNSEGKE